MLSAIGVPPDASFYVTSIVQHVRYMLGVFLTLYVMKLNREKHLMLPPGEQVRRHLKDGGWFH